MKHEVNKRDTEGLIDSIRATQGINIAAILTKRLDKGYHVSLRSNDPNYSVASIAHKLDGGGHKLAAGCFIEARSIDEAEKILLSHVKAILQ